MSRSRGLLLAGLVSFTFALPAAANTQGQYGFTGKDNSCLQCHGAKQYDGLKLTVTTGDTLACWVTDNEASDADNVVLKKLDIPSLDYGAVAAVKVAITEPDAATAPACPTSNCCEPGSPADALCNQDDFRVDGTPTPAGTCVPLFDDCTSGVNAGFNMEVINGGYFSLLSADEGVRFEVATGLSVPGEQFSCLGGPTCSGLDAATCGTPQVVYEGGNPDAPRSCDANACAMGQVGCDCTLGDGFDCTGATSVGGNLVGSCTKTVVCEGKTIFPNGCPTNSTVTAEDLASGYVTGCRCEDGYTLSPVPDEGGTPPYTCVLPKGAEVTHSISRPFAGAIEWNMQYTAPTEDTYSDAVEFWVGANVANGNGKADQNDLNSNFQMTVAVGGNLPSFCATCADGTLPDDSGNCAGCGCSTTNAGEAPYALVGLAILGAAVLVRRRRR